jgi:hypothetical protein
MSMKNSNDNIDNRTRNLPTCSAVPQQTAQLRAEGDVCQQITEALATTSTKTSVAQTQYDNCAP